MLITKRQVQHESTHSPYSLPVHLPPPAGFTTAGYVCRASSSLTWSGDLQNAGDGGKQSTPALTGSTGNPTAKRRHLRVLYARLTPVHGSQTLRIPGAQPECARRSCLALGLSSHITAMPERAGDVVRWRGGERCVESRWMPGERGLSRERSRRGDPHLE